MTPRDIISSARACIGTRFRHQGRLKDNGLDCVGLLVWVARSFENNVQDCLDYDRHPAHGLLEGHLKLSGLREIAVDEARPGDVALFRFDGPPQHVAILADAREPFSMIHAYMPARRVVEHRMDEIWQKRFVGAYRFPGV